jgi:branched-chain amino acid transport system ATP-binding protein
MMTVTDLVVTRGTLAVLNGVDLSVQRGDMLGVFGQNGAGKSTLLFALAGMAPVRRGEILLDGRPVEGMSPQRLLRLGVALVPQGRRVFASLTVRQNLELGGLRAGNRRTLQRRIDDYLARHPQLARRADVPAGQLSGGEQGLCVLGRGLMAEPSVLLLDEPLMGLAPGTGHAILAEVRAISNGGCAVIVVEHNREAVADYATRMIEIIDGKATV